MKVEKIPKDLLKIFAKTKATILSEEFLIVKLPLKENIVIKDKLKELGDSFYSFNVNREEITLIVSENDWKKISSYFIELKIERTYKIIEMEAKLEWTVVGYFSYLARLLAEFRIAAGVVSCYSKDYLIIKKHDIFMAIQVLTDFFSRCKRLIGE
jgi:hypothetical protein